MAKPSEITNRILQAAGEILDPRQPMTLRHLYYLLVSQGILNNEQSEYQKMGRVIGIGRKTGVLDYKSLRDTVRIA